MMITNRPFSFSPNLNNTACIIGPVDIFKLAWYSAAIVSICCSCSNWGVDDKSITLNGTVDSSP